MNIVIVTSGHPPFDERIFYKFGHSFKKYNYNVAIVCSTENIQTESEGILISGFDGQNLSKKNKVRILYVKIKVYDPDIIICCEPITILAASKFKKERSRHVKIISDITEYYPYQNTLNQYSGIFRILAYLFYFSFNIYTTYLADYLFIGEPGKAKLYKLLAPTIKKTIVGYYPPLKFFNYSPPKYDGEYLSLCYSGNISIARGFPGFVKLVIKAAQHFPEKIFLLKIIGKFEQPELNTLLDELSRFNNVKYEYKDWINYEDYSREYSDVDICIDLRDKNIIFNRSIPIKIFDCMACGKPVIFSNLDSFKDIEDVNEFGLLVEPDEIDKALERIELYLNNPEKLKEDSLAARKLFENKYNWELIEKKIIGIIENLIKK